MFKGFVILLLIGGKAVLTQDEFGQVEREAVRIFEREHIDSRDLGLTGFLSLTHQFVKQRDSFVERTEERLLFGFDDRSDLRLLLYEFGVRLAEIFDELRYELVEEGRTHIQERIAVANRATKDSTDDITRFLVRR